MKNKLHLLFALFIFTFRTTTACSILYYIDTVTGKIYAVNNEDYWYNVKPYIKIIPHDKEKLARLWYGWKDFAQGGINESGLFFDGATTPEQKPIAGYSKPNGNLGDKILANCKTVTEAINFLEQRKIALTNAHLLFGDKTGNAAVVEWVNGVKKITFISDHKLMVTNFLLTDTTAGNYPCPRYNAMEQEIERLRQSHDTIGFKQVANIAAKAVQPKNKNTDGKEGGTLYSTFVNITDMEFILIYKLDNKKMTRLDLKTEFLNSKKRTIQLE